MLVSKRFLSDINIINKNTLTWAIQSNTSIALVNRALTINEETRKPIDDITEDEIKQGTSLVKGYCITNNELGLLKQYLPLVLNSIELLTELKALKLTEINNAYENAISLVQKEYIPQTEMLSFETQERESKAYKDSGYTDASLCPFMQSIANARGVDLKTLCDKALEKATLYRQASGMLIGKRQGLQDKIEKVQTKEDLDGISWK